MSMQSAPISFILDNTFVSTLGLQVKNGVTLGDIASIAFELPNIRAAIVPNMIYTLELQGKVYDPDLETHRPTYRQVYQPPGLQKREQLRQSAKWIRANTHLEPEHIDLQRMLNDPKMLPRKLVIAGSEYDKTAGQNLHDHLKELSSGIDDADPKTMYSAMRKAGMFNKGIGESRISDLIENTQFHSHIYVLSNDFKAFKDPDSPLFVDHLKTADKPAKSVSYCTNESFFGLLLKSPECLDYVNERLRSMKNLGENFSLSARDVHYAMRQYAKEGTEHPQGYRIGVPQNDALFEKLQLERVFNDGVTQASKTLSYRGMGGGGADKYLRKPYYSPGMREV